MIRTPAAGNRAGPGSPLRSVLIAGGGSAGHVEPALAIADALRAARPEVEVTLLGTTGGLEARLVPARGYRLATVPKVPLPRRPDPALLTLPGRLAGAIRAAGAVLDDTAAQVLVGVGGYVCVPAYLAARARRTGIVVHEQNVRPGLANRLGARLTREVAVTFAGTRLPHAVVTGMPLREEIRGLDRARARAEARRELGLAEPDAPTLLVTGGSQGARRINTAVTAAAPGLLAAGVQVLHVTGPAQLEAVTAQLAAVLGPQQAAAAGRPGARYRLLGYADRMALAYAGCDLALCRAGAMTCSELAAVGMAAVFVPLAIGNGEQRLNAGPLVAAGAALLVPDAELTVDAVLGPVLQLLTDAPRLSAMGAAARAAAPPDAASALVAMVLRAAG